MNKWIASLLTVLCAGAFTIPAVAEGKTLVPTYYDHRLDSPLYASLPEGMTIAERREVMSGYFQLSDLVPLDKGGVLLLGTYEYFDIPKEESFEATYADDMKRSEAYAIALGAQGERLWSMRLGDPQAYGNRFFGTQLQDGRFLLKLWGDDGHFDTAYFIVSDTGEVEEMLSSDALRALGVLETLSVRGDAYYAGGAVHDSGAFAPMGESDQIMKLDADLSPIWTLDNPFGVDAFVWDWNTKCVPVEDGTLWCGRYGAMGSMDGTMRPGVFKVSHEGELLWIYDDAHEYAMNWYINALPLADGGALFGCSIDPREPTPLESDENVYLCWLDETGSLVNVKGYQQDTGLSDYRSLHAFGEGFVVAGALNREGDTQFCLLYVDAEGEVLGMAKLPALVAESYAFMTLDIAEGKDGRLYAYGIEQIDVFNEESNTYNMARYEIYYVEIKAEDFINE